MFPGHGHSHWLQNEPSLTVFEMRAVFLFFASVITTHCDFVGLSKHHLLVQFRGELFKRPRLCTFSGVAGVRWAWSHTCSICGDLSSDSRNYVGSCHSACQPGGSHRSGLLPEARGKSTTFPLRLKLRVGLQSFSLCSDVKASPVTRHRGGFDSWWDKLQWTSATFTIDDMEPFSKST